MTDVATLEAAPVAATLEASPAPVPAAADGRPFSFEIEADDKPVYTANLDLVSIPGDIREHLLKSAVRGYILNRVSTAAAKVKKDNAPFDSYDAAVANDPLQTLVAKPEGERAVVDYAGIVSGAIKALYEGTIGKRATGEKKAKPLKDPLITQITRAVVAEVYEKGKALDPSYKYPTAQKEVGADGLAYLQAKIAEKVAAGADAATLNAFLENRYVKPARIMLGLDTPGKLKDADGIL